MEGVFPVGPVPVLAMGASPLLAEAAAEAGFQDALNRSAALLAPPVAGIAIEAPLSGAASPLAPGSQAPESGAPAPLGVVPLGTVPLGRVPPGSVPPTPCAGSTEDAT